MCFDVFKCNIGFIDLIDFIFMVLDKMFNILVFKEMVKGYFLYLVNIKDNQIVDLEYLFDI